MYLPHVVRRMAECNGSWQHTLARLDRLLEAELARLRARPRSPVSHVIPGGVVEDDEAVCLVQELLAEHTGSDPAVRVEPIWDLPAGLAHAQRVYDLDPFELDVVVLAIAPELDARYARLIAHLNDHAARTRPTLGLAVAVFGADRWSWPAVFAPGGRLMRFGLVELEGEGPLSTLALRATGIWSRFLGEPPRPTLGRKLDELVLDPATRERAQAIAAALVAGTCRTVIISGPDGSGRDALASALAAELGAGVVSGDVKDLGTGLRDARWHEAVLVLRGAGIVADEQLQVVYVVDDAGLEEVIAKRPDALEIRIERPDLVTRRRIWESFVAADRRDPALDLDCVVSRFPIAARRIEIAATRAIARTARATTADLLDACRTLPDRRFEGLAERLVSSYSWDDLVIPDDTRAELELVLAWARGGRVALQAWGVQASGSRGLACLFHGPPGTGKTMAAQVLSSAIGVDVMRIDLSRIVSKYIGETEKNLGGVFDAAREANVILFFDEADALFGKRSAVKDSHDRYANIETGFLLQRLESHDGLVILATNLRANLDEAFTRRLHVIAEFTLPDPADRRRIWERALPARDLCADDVDTDLLARRFKLSGGEIRNAVVTAALVASSEGRYIAMTHLIRGVWRELRKTGRMVDVDDFGVWRGEALRYANKREST